MTTSVTNNILSETKIPGHLHTTITKWGDLFYPGGCHFHRLIGKIKFLIVKTNDFKFEIIRI